MPVIESTKRSLRKAVSNRAFNLKFKDAYKKLAKSFVAKPSSELLEKVFSGLDKGVKHNIFHKNKVARLKSQFAKKLVNKDVAKVVAKKAPKKAAMKKSSKKK